MRCLSVALFVTLAVVSSARPQHQQHQQVDPAYLRDFYSQIAQSAGQKAGNDATPIYEEGAQEIAPQYQQPSQQLRVKDTVAEQQIRQQQQQPAYISPNLRQNFNYQQQPQAQQIQYQPQQVAYKAPAPKQTLVHRPKPAQQQYQAAKYSQEEDQEYDSNPSYQFGFDVKDDEFTNYQNRKEVREGDVIKGSYSVVDSDGFIRTVTYTADPKEGFKAEVVRSPTDIVVKMPKPYQENQKSYEPQQQQYAQQPASQPAYRPAHQKQAAPQYQYQ